MSLPAVLAPLRHKQYRWLFGSQLVSNLGDWLDYLALIILVTVVWHRGVEGMAALVIAMAVPSILLAPVAGVLADRLAPRTAMVACDLARCVTVAALVLAPNLYAVVGLVVVRDAFATLFTPAQQIAVRLTVPAESLLSASSLSQLVMQGSKIVGPALGGLLVAAFGNPHPVFLVDAGSFLLSALLLLPLRAARETRADEASAAAGDGHGADEADGPVEAASSGMLHEAREGLRHLTSRPVLATAVGGFSVLLFLAVLFDTLAPLVLRQLGFDARLIGVAMGVIGLGTVVGSVLLGQFAERVRPLALMGGGAALCGLLCGAVGAAVSSGATGAVWVWLLVLFGFGFALAAVIVPFPVILQTETPIEYLGRVVATATALQSLGAVTGPLAAAALAAWLGLGTTPILAGAGLLALGAFLAVNARRHDPQPAPQAEAAPEAVAPQRRAAEPAG
ncbi:MFS transporter [Kitasatospora kazusensis]|uniref:MFS transporter n=1 Tax=Kitasatospora kazusensis TaxID=407974 RepID=A0ABP5KTK1_9ACTN